MKPTVETPVKGERMTARDYLVSRLPSQRQKEGEAALSLLFNDPDDPAIWFYAVQAEAIREAVDAQLEAAVAQKSAPAHIEAKLRETITATIKSEVARQFTAQSEEQRKILTAIYAPKTWHRLLISRFICWGIIPLVLFASFTCIVFRAPSMWAISTLLEIPGAYVSLENGKAWVNMPKDSVDIVEDAGRPDRTILKIKLPPRDLLEARKLLEAINDERAKPSR